MPPPGPPSRAAAAGSRAEVGAGAGVRRAPEHDPRQLGGSGTSGIGHQLDLRALGAAGDRHPGLHLRPLRSATMLSPGASERAPTVDQAAFQGEVLPIAAVAAAHGLDRAHRRQRPPRLQADAQPPASRVSRPSAERWASPRPTLTSAFTANPPPCCAGAGLTPEHDDVVGEAGRQRLGELEVAGVGAELRVQRQRLKKVLRAVPPPDSSIQRSSRCSSGRRSASKRKSPAPLSSASSPRAVKRPGVAVRRSKGMRFSRGRTRFSRRTRAAPGARAPGRSRHRGSPPASIRPWSTRVKPSSRPSMRPLARGASIVPPTVKSPRMRRRASTLPGRGA